MKTTTNKDKYLEDALINFYISLKVQEKVNYFYYIIILKFK